MFLMKQFLVLLFSLTCVLALCACHSDGLIPDADDTGDAEVHSYDASSEETAVNSEDKTYKNNKVWKVKFKNGVTVTVGVGGDTDNRGIYLSPACSESLTVQPTGFYYQVKNHVIEVCNELRADKVGSEVNANSADLAIVDHSFERLVPANYVNSSSYGIRWVFDPLGSPETSDVIDLRAVRLTDNYLFGIVRVYIEADKNGTFQITKVCDADVSVTGEATAAERRELCQKAADFMLNGNSGFSSSDWSEKAIMEGAIVHAPVDTYFKNLVGPEREPLIRGRIGTYELYAVNMPTAYHSSGDSGGVTVYLTHQSYLWGFGEPVTEEDQVFAVVGRDAYFPQTESGMIW